MILAEGLATTLQFMLTRSPKGTLRTCTFKCTRGGSEKYSGHDNVYDCHPQKSCPTINSNQDMKKSYLFLALYCEGSARRVALLELS